MSLFPHAQIDDYSRAGKALTVGRRAVNCSHRPAHVGQASNGRHTSSVVSCSTHDSPCITHRGLHCAPVFSHSIAPVLRGRSARAGRSLPLGPARCKFMPRFLIGGGNQLNRIAHKLGGDRPNPFHSFSPFHGVTFHIQEHATKGVGSAQDRIGEIQNAAYC